MISIALSILLVFTALAARADLCLDWTSLRNPVLSYPDWSVKDCACEYRDGVFYLFFSAFYEDNGGIRSHVVEVTIRDFKTYSEPILNFDGEEDGWIGMCSPDITKVGNTYYLVFNSWGDKEGKLNQLFYMRSKDLVKWNTRKPLAANLTSGTRAIDAAIAFNNKKYYLFWKEKQITRCAVSSSIDGKFKFIEDGYPTFQKANGEAVNWCENYTLIKIDGKWRLICTIQPRPHKPCIFTMANSGEKNSDWLTWIQGLTPELPKQEFNSGEFANAATLMSLQEVDGYIYLLYAGNTEGKSYIGRGWNKLGLARSKDLIEWIPAGMSKPWNSK